MRFVVESRLVQARPAHRPSDSPRRQPSGHSSRTKSVMRNGTIFTPQMVTGEFYAWVTTSSITLPVAQANSNRDKRPACRWLRSSSPTALIKAALLCNRYVNILARLVARIEMLEVDISTRFVFSHRPAAEKSLLALLT